jgi:hypothetical protein
MPKKIQFEDPKVVVIGKLEEMTGQGGKNNDDGMHRQWTKLASSVRISL